MAEKWACDYCKKKFNNKKEAKKCENDCKKKYASNNPDKWSCDYCGEKFNNPKDAEKHEERCSIDHTNTSSEIPKKIQKKLDSFIHEGEKILYSFKGVWGSHSRWTDSSSRSSARLLSGNKVNGAGNQFGSPWLILTSERVLIIGKGLLTMDTREIPYEHIKSIDYEQGVLQDRLTFLAHSSMEAIQLYRRDRKKTKEIPRIIKGFIKKLKSKTSQASSSLSSADELKKYHDLMKKKIITKEEFDLKKKELLGL